MPLGCQRSADAIRVSISLDKYPLDAIKQAALSLTGAVFVRLSRSQRAVAVELRPKNPTTKAALSRLAAGFARGLEAEAVRSRLEREDRGVREHVIRLALHGEQTPLDDPGIALSAEQQRELDRLIAEVEAEIAKETTGKAADPMGVTKTWEEANGRDKA